MDWSSRREVPLIFLSVTVIGFMLMLCFADKPGEAQVGIPPAYAQANLALGGALYCNWCKLKEVETADTHPLYPEGGRLTGIATQRCGSCHGWDYLGKEGRYKTGPYFTGIKGVFQSRGIAPAVLFQRMTHVQSGHDFSQYLSEEELWAVVKFVREGLIDIRPMIGEDGAPITDDTGGQDLYTARCDRCHGKDGTKKDCETWTEGKQGIAEVSLSNAELVLHSIRWGHPALEDAPALLTELTDAQMLGLIKYCQGLK